MRELFSYALDLLVPPRRTERLVRALTLDELFRLGDGEALPYHDPRVTALVWELKYYGSARSRALAGAFLHEHVLAAAGEELGPPLLVPVPMHTERLRERGHNHTELLCEAALSCTDEERVHWKKVWRKVWPSALALTGPQAKPRTSEDFLERNSLVAIHYAPHALWRTRLTPTQQGLPKATRIKNVAGSMAAEPNIVGGRACIVIDDVITTGATLEEATRALRHAGARAVHTIALARS